MKTIRPLLVPLLLFPLFLSGLLFCTEAGLRFIIQNINRYSGGMVSIGEIHGRVIDAFTVGQIRVDIPGFNVGAGQVAWRWRPGRLLLGELRLGTLVAEDVEVRIKADSQSAAPAEGPFVPPTSLLPFGLVLENFRLDRLRIIGSDETQLFEVDSIAARLEGNSERLTIASASLESSDIGFDVHGNIGTGDDWSVDLMGSWRLANFGFHPINGTFSTRGPLESPHLELGVNSSGLIRAAIDVINLFEKPQWTGTLDATDVDLSALFLHCPQILLSTVNGELSGDLNHYRGLVKAKGSWQDLKGMSLVGEISGDGLGIDFQSLRIQQGEKFAEVENGKINWRDIFGWQGQFYFSDIDLSVITDSLSGKASGEVFSAGEVTENGVVASFEIAVLEGVLQEQKVSANGNVFLTETGIHTDGLTVESGAVEGVAHIERAGFSWDEQLTWSAELYLKNFNPAVLHPDLYGAVNAIVSTTGMVGDSGLEGYISIAEISGSLLGDELSGGGDIRLSGDAYSTTGLVLKSGPSELKLEGHAGDALGVDFTFSSPELSTIIPDSSGSVHVNGSLTEHRSSPKLDVRFKGRKLRYREMTALDLHGKLQAELNQDGIFTGKLYGTSLGVSDMMVAKGMVEISGSLQDHEIIVGAESPALLLKGRVRGRYGDQWRGELSQVLVKSDVYGAWQQQHRAEIGFGSKLTMDGFCLAHGDGAVCVEGSFSPEDNHRWSVGGEVRSFPLSVLSGWQVSPLPLQGRVQGEVRAAGDGTGVSFAKVSLAVPNMIFSANTDDPEISSFNLNESLFTLNQQDGGLQARLVTQPETGGRVVMDVNIENAGKFSQSVFTLPVRGRFEVTDIDLNLLDAFLEYGVEPAGLLNSTLALEGTVGAPVIYGTTSIQGGGVGLLHQGVALENVSLFLRAEGERATISCSANSGPGQLIAKGDVIYENGRIEGVIDLQGDDFLLVNLPEYVIRVTPDVRLLFTSDKGSVEGKVEVPYGLITPEEMVDSVRVSEDVIFVSGKVEEMGVKGWPFSLDLEVILGDDVRLEGYGLTGRLGGMLQVNTSKDNFITGRGQLNLIDGVFSLYGRTLDIERGRVLFNGGPIDNPGLDVRAQVKVSDQQAMGTGYTVGVDISGLVEDLQFSLFSDPYMDDTEILSLMIVGKSLAGSSQEENILQSAASSLGLKGVSDLAKGLGNMLPVDDLRLEGSGQKENVSLVVGKRIFEDLYIGYDMNMFSQLGQFRVRYDLKRGFSVETRSSSESTGADLFYSFKR